MGYIVFIEDDGDNGSVRCTQIAGEGKPTYEEAYAEACADARKAAERRVRRRFEFAYAENARRLKEAKGI